MGRRLIWPVCSAAIFLVLFAAYAVSPVRTSFDSRWSIHTAWSFIDGQSGSLADDIPLIKRENEYAIEYHDGRPYNYFPMGTSLLSVPIVWAASLALPGFPNFLSHNIPAQFEGLVASLFGALAGVLFFWLVMEKFQEFSLAIFCTFVFCFATSMWSTATRALWQHGPLVLMLTIAMLILARAQRRPSLINYLGVPLAFAFLIRPTASLPIVVLSLYVLIYYRPWIKGYLLGALVVAIPWFALNLSIFHHFLPPYYLPQRVEGSTTVGTALAGNLVSPGRGIFVFSPILIGAVPGFLLSLRDRRDRVLNLAYGAIILLHWLVISRFDHWSGGYCFGPRLMTDVVPFLTYLLAFGVNAVVDQRNRLFRNVGLIAIVALTIVSTAIHAQGAVSWAPYLWCAEPVSIDTDPERLWSWSDLQFMRGVSDPVPMPNFGPSLPRCPGFGKDAAVSLRQSNTSAGCLGPGWSAPEPWGTWTDGAEASLAMALPVGAPPSAGFELVANVRGLVAPAAPSERVDVLANGTLIAQWTFTLGDAHGERRAAIPATVVRGKAPLKITFRPVEVRSPAELGLSGDRRALGIGLESVRIVARPG